MPGPVRSILSIYCMESAEIGAAMLAHISGVDSSGLVGTVPQARVAAVRTHQLLASLRLLLPQYCIARLIIPALLGALHNQINNTNTCECLIDPKPDLYAVDPPIKRR